MCTIIMHVHVDVYIDINVLTTFAKRGAPNIKSILIGRCMINVVFLFICISKYFNTEFHRVFDVHISLVLILGI